MNRFTERFATFTSRHLPNDVEIIVTGLSITQSYFINAEVLSKVGVEFVPPIPHVIRIDEELPYINASGLRTFLQASIASPDLRYVTAENCCQLAVLAQKFEAWELQDRCRDFFDRYFCEIPGSETKKLFEYVASKYRYSGLFDMLRKHIANSWSSSEIKSMTLPVQMAIFLCNNQRNPPSLMAQDDSPLLSSRDLVERKPLAEFLIGDDEEDDGQEFEDSEATEAASLIPPAALQIPLYNNSSEQERGEIRMSLRTSRRQRTVTCFKPVEAGRFFINEGTFGVHVDIEQALREDPPKQFGIGPLVSHILAKALPGDLLTRFSICETTKKFEPFAQENICAITEYVARATGLPVTPLLKLTVQKKINQKFKNTRYERNLRDRERNSIQNGSLGIPRDGNSPAHFSVANQLRRFGRR